MDDTATGEVNEERFDGIVDVDLDAAEAARLWAASGAQWLTDPAADVPTGLVRRVVGLVAALERRGAGLAGLVPGAGLGLLAERAALMGLPRSGRVSAGGASRLLRARDGWYVLSIARDDDRDLVPALLETETFDHEPGRVDLWDVIERAVADRPIAELCERAALLGLPGGAVGEVVDGRAVLADRVGPAAARGVDGAVVVDLSSLWAGPLCSDVLARLGARTIKVESTRRPDGGRAARRFFSVLHGRAESVALDLASASGNAELRRLLLAADVVIEGSRPRALEQMGFDARQLAQVGPKVWVSITARGRGPGVRDRVGFGDDAAAVGGLVAWVEDAPVFLADAVADPLTGLTAAHAVTELIERKGRWLVDIALARVSRSVAAEPATGKAFEPTTAPAARPRPRSDPGRAMPLGRDTERVLAWAADVNQRPRPGA